MQHTIAKIWIFSALAMQTSAHYYLFSLR